MVNSPKFGPKILKSRAKRQKMKKKIAREVKKDVKKVIRSRAPRSQRGFRSRQRKSARRGTRNIDRYGSYGGGSNAFRVAQPGERRVLPLMGPAPRSMEWGEGERMTVDFASVSIARTSATTGNSANQVFGVINGGAFVYKKILTTCTLDYATNSYLATAWMPEITSSTTRNTRLQVQLGWHNKFVIRSLYFDYVPTKNKMSDGAIVFAPTKEQSDTPEETTFQTLAGIQGAVRIPICERARVWVVRPYKMHIANEVVWDIDDAVSQVSLLAAVDTVLTTGSDVLGSLEGHMIVDMYGARGLIQSAALTPEERLLKQLENAGIDLKKVLKDERGDVKPIVRQETSSSTSSSTDCRFTSVSSKAAVPDEKKIVEDYVMLRSKLGNHQ